MKFLKTLIRHYAPWQPIRTAPRDGRWIEVKCSYGLEPWYDLARWSDECASTRGDIRGKLKLPEPSWVLRGGCFVDTPEQRSLQWRAFVGNPREYEVPMKNPQISNIDVAELEWL